MAQKKLSKTRQQIHAIYEENELAGLKQIQTRARSMSIGPAGGGIIEVAMRGDFSSLWYQLPPTEAVELIAQLAAAAGLDIALRPKQDFSAWRSWDATLPACITWMGAAPWQMSDEDRQLLAEVKAKNLKPVEEQNKSIEASNDESKSE